MLLTRTVKTVIRRALSEDLRKRGDITTRACVPSELRASAVIAAKESGIIAGQAVAAGVFQMVSKKRPSAVIYTMLIADGAPVKPGDEIACIDGAAWVILVGERTALNILARCSGIATLTRKCVEAVNGTAAQICDTRKTAPGLRYLDKAAVGVGGGVNHRFGLHDAFLIKENHITAAGGITAAIESCRIFGSRHGRFRVMVEARSVDEFREALAARPHRILLDNMDTDDIQVCVAERDADIPQSGRVEIEASGGITLDNVRSVAETGVDFISIGALTHSAKALDLSLIIREIDT